jgi:hypothetical protein
MVIESISLSASQKLDEVKQQYEVWDHNNAEAILTLKYPELLIEICDVLLKFELTIDQIKRSGGKTCRW